MGAANQKAIAADHAFEVAQVFAHPMAEEVAGVEFGRLLLILVVEMGRQRVMGVVRLVDEVGQGQLQGVGGQPPDLIP